MGLTGVYQRPYVVSGNNKFVRKKDDEESSAAQTQREEEGNSNSKSKGLQYVEQEQKPFTQPYTKTSTEPSWQETRALIQNQALTRYKQPSTVTDSDTDISATTVTDKNSAYLNRSSKINIAQILKDFKSTESAIGTPDNVKEEVNEYLDLIEKQVVKDSLNVKLIKSNLKNASSLLDNYISTTLNKDSKVVENWVDALFLQQIDYKYNESEINPEFLVKFPEGKANKAANTETKKTVDESAETEIAENSDTTEKKTSSIVPENKELKSMFIQAKKLAYANEPAKAIASFEQALNKANDIGDTETVSKVFYEVGKIYDDHDYYAQALKSYHMALNSTDDDNLKTKAHYSMAQIYDDVNQISPALDHYYVSVAYAGESDNAVAQSTSLTKMGNIYTDMYDTNSLEYFDVAKDIAENTDNSKVKGYVSSSMAKAYDKFGEPQESLKSYSEAVQHYEEAESPLKVAQNYIGASDVMLQYGNEGKALSLLKKAQNYARQTDDVNLMNEISTKLTELV
jgi:tetratricopeptide (TPR) repeat protein